MFKQTLTREKLQSLAEEHRLQQLAHFIDTQVANGVTSAATQGATTFLYEREKPIRRHPSELVFTDEELMGGLRIKFPGTSVTWVEEWVDVMHNPRIPPTRVLKKGIKIDWS